VSTITTTTDLDRLRVGVELSGWGTDGPVSVFRVHSDGSRHEVRSMSAVSGGAAFGWDYETPLSAAVTYEADDTTGTVTSAAATLAVAYNVATLTVPGLPSFGGVVLPASKVSPTRKRPSVALDVIGRSTYIVKSDVLKAPEFTLELYTQTDAEAYSLTSMFAIAPVLLLRMPGTRVTDWCYVSVGDLEERPGIPFKTRPDSGRTDGEFATWSLSCQVTDAPVGGMVGDPTSTWQALKDTGMTWQQLKDMNLTWLQVLKGEFTS
jgi:hypothetical protein